MRPLRERAGRDSSIVRTDDALACSIGGPGRPPRYIVYGQITASVARQQLAGAHA